MGERTFEDPDSLIDIANEVLNGEVADPDDRESSILRRRTVIAAALGRTGIDVTDMRAAIAARKRILRSVESKGLRPRSQTNKKK